MNIYDYAEQKRISLKQVMDFTTAVNPLGPSIKAKNILRKNIKNIDIFPDKKLRYLTGLIKKKEGLNTENILFGHGSTELLRTIFRTLKMRTVLIPSPVSKHFEKIASLNNITIKHFPLNQNFNFSMDLDGILKAMKKTDALLMPYPHDVVGTALGIDDLARLINEADKLNKILILDESYRDFTMMNSPTQEVIKSETSIIIRTFSLFYAMAGLPLAYGVGPVGMVHKIREQIFSDEISTLATDAAIASVKDTHYRTKTRKFIDMEKDYFIKAFNRFEGLECFDTPCPFVLLSLKERPESLEEVFSRYHILIDEFSDEEGRHYMKVPVKKHKWNARFIKTLRNALNVNKQ